MKKLKVHFTGIKGVGMAPLAIIAKEAGFIVSGSDVEDEFITDAALKKAGIVPSVGFRKENIIDHDLVIVTGAHSGLENIEAQEARTQGIKVVTQGEAVGIFMNGKIFDKNFIGISVAGTHGKTTTAAMVATIIEKSGLNPSYVIGTGNVGSLGSPGHYGKGRHFIAEADEYMTDPKHNKKPKFLWQSPKIAVITNIEFDHPDVYDTIEDIREAYLAFAHKIDEKGTLIACGDDLEVRHLLQEYKKRVITYGFGKDCNYVLEKVHISGSHMFFTVSATGMIISDFMVKVIGNHNALNALAAIITCLEIGLPVDKIKKGLMEFTGSMRRLEYMGELASGAVVYDDYAHHPTELKKTLGALRAQYPNKKIVAVFQPHTYSRTKKLLEEFIRSFNDVDTVILTQIYSSLREEPDPDISSFILSDRMKQETGNVFYLETLSDVVKYLNESKFRSDTVIVTMGAGDVYKIHSKLQFE
jgi:UDP-N-acetylmuramate--alanine ligase